MIELETAKYKENKYANINEAESRLLSEAITLKINLIFWAVLLWKLRDKLRR